MGDLTGLLKINGKDLWTEFGAFLAETSADGRENMGQLLCVPPAKEVTYVDFRERDGEEYPEDPKLTLQAADRTLQLCVTASSETERLSRYRGLTALLTSGWLTVEVKDTGTYKMIYKQMEGQPEWYAVYGGGLAALLKVTLHEPSPLSDDK